MRCDAEKVIEAISSIRLTDIPEEYEIHKLVEYTFQNREINYIHEASLGRGRRVDFLVNRTAVEIKKGAPAPAALVKQLSGYLESEKVDEIVAVTRRRVKLPEKIAGKCVYALSLDRLWGVTLP